jgi:hypothetical protein
MDPAISQGRLVLPLAQVIAFFSPAMVLLPGRVGRLFGIKAVLLGALAMNLAGGPFGPSGFDCRFAVLRLNH